MSGGPQPSPSQDNSCTIDNDVRMVESEGKTSSSWLHSPHKSVQRWACPHLSVKCSRPNSMPLWPSFSSGTPSPTPTFYGGQSLSPQPEAGFPLLLCLPSPWGLCGPWGGRSHLLNSQHRIPGTGCLHSIGAVPGDQCPISQCRC